MAAETGFPAIKRLLIILSVLGAGVLGAIYAIVTPPTPVIKPVASQTPSRTLAYQQQIVRPGDAEPAQDDAQAAGETQKHAMAPADAKPAKETSQSAPAPQPQPQAATPAQPRPPASQQGQPPDMAALPPDGEAEAYDDPNGLPWQHRAQPNYSEGPYPGSPEEGYDGPPGAWPDEEGYPQEGGRQQDAEAWPGDDADPNAYPAGPSGPPEEWVQVLVSGAGMHGMASEEAPMLFAFPYGRTLRVISRYGNWVEVTDPKSATTGWMKAQYLAPVASPRGPEQMEAGYGDEPPRRRRGWWRRNGGEGIADMIGRALGGGF